ncbi:RNA 3'-terminal phosphate cyclase-like protein [Nematocida sp. AWRm77]|nr:RNA 3'-terminal phosphate cyclase-like protein [Nematocida sp. AWRm77]
MQINSDSVELVLSLCVISQKRVRITSPRIKEDAGRIKEYVKLLQRITEGSVCRVEESTLEYVPGVLVGGQASFSVVHATIPEVLYCMLLLCGFAKKPMRVSLRGCTNKEGSLSVDLIKSVHCKVLLEFGVVSDIRIARRALYPSLDGEVLFLGDVAKELQPVRMDQREELERIASVNYSARLSSDVLTRITNLHRDALKQMTPSVKVYNDIGNKSNTGETPGFGTLLLVFGQRSIYYAEYTVDGTCSLLTETPESRSEKCIKSLLRSVRKSGAFDAKVQNFLLTLLPLTLPEASCVLIGKPDAEGKHTLRLLEQVLKYTYTIEKYQRTEKDVNTGVSDSLFLIKSVGVGYSNLYHSQE